MSRLVRTFALFSLALTPLVALAQEAPPEPDAPPVDAPTADAEPSPEPEPVEAAPEPRSEEEIHEELRAVHRAMEAALNERDLDALLEHVDERVVFSTMNGDAVRGRDGVREYFARMLEGPDARVRTVRAQFEADDLSVLHGQDVAIAFGHSNDHYELTDGSTFDVTALWSGTLVRGDDGRWRIASFHYSTNMFDNPVLDAQRKYLLIGGGVAVLIGVLLGLLIGRRLGRARAAGAA